ncbi:WD40 repeat domain-containing protein [Sorangium sp. So ce124]|uniref:WD40 repeat domain-containing protein n=1 Tax=Sorangium sp. So ce124 TaxID=3133280 RepID=UPI003F60194D
MSNGRFGGGAAGLGAIAVVVAIEGCGSAPPAPSQQTQHTPAAPPEAWPPPGARLAKPEGHLAKVNCLAFSPDGRQLVSGGEDRVLLVWDVATGQVVQWLEGHGGWVCGCAFLPDGRGVVSGGWGGEVFAWDRKSGERRRLGALSPTDAVMSLSVRPDGGEILVGTLSGVARAWELGSGAATLEQDALIRPGESSVVWATGYLDDGRAFAGGNAGVVVWNGRQAVTARYDAASAVALPGGLLALGGEGEVTLLQPGGALERLGAQERWVYGLALSPRRDLLLAGDAAGSSARVFRLADRSLRCELKRSAGISAAAFDPTGTWFAVAGDDGSVALARVADCTGVDRQLAVRQLGIPQRRMRSVAAGQAVLVGDGAGNVSAWSTATWSLAGRWSAHAGEVTALAALPDGGWVSGGLDHAVVAMSGVSSAPPRRIGQLRNFPWAVRPSPDGMSVLSADAAGDLTLLPLGEGGAPATLLSERRPLYALAVAGRFTPAPPQRRSASRSTHRSTPSPPPPTASTSSPSSAMAAPRCARSRRATSSPTSSRSVTAAGPRCSPTAASSRPAAAPPSAYASRTPSPARSRRSAASPTSASARRRRRARPRGTSSSGPRFSPRAASPAYASTAARTCAA